ncbi:FecR family protein [Hymenobacter sp. GOD-10R]|uniref:FecR family protein n=1 Tax=Hymenobacter sp. GOD-10R TaxID=3093922 RepID=UPI002D7A2BC3|nr:FecR domain-containing protein [Hymenobacter sp. GOD-10R]WRQ29740.1 FecR domain-containing protein [Hymenobacter sp. GOD-10R]
MTESEFHHLLQRYLDGRCTPAEQAAVEQWYNRLEQVETKMLPVQNQEAIEDAIWHRMEQARSATTPKMQVVQRPVSFWQTPQLQWAAILTLFALSLGVWFGLTKRFHPAHNIAASASNWTRHTNTTQQVQAFQLPDGSRITLNPGSSLRYASAFAGPRREVYLEGEAFFKVSKNPRRPFLVFTKQVVTTVLGTSFRVKAYSDSKEASVAVREGKVAVQAREDARLDVTPAKPAANGVLLLPNQQAVYSIANHHLQKGLVEKPAVLAPQTFEFEERPVMEVLSALEKAYGVEMAYDKVKLAGCTVSIAFYNEPLFEKLDLLCKSLGASYTLAGTQVVIHSNGCQAR